MPYINHGGEKAPKDHARVADILSALIAGQYDQIREAKLYQSVGDEDDRELPDRVGQ